MILSSSTGAMPKPIHAKGSAKRIENYPGAKNVILGIKVIVRDKTFDLDLEESRDWGYIPGIIAEGGLGAELFVFMP